MDRYTEESACDSLCPGIGELDARNFGENVNPRSDNSDLIEHLLLRFCIDPIMIGQ